MVNVVTTETLEKVLKDGFILSGIRYADLSIYKRGTDMILYDAKEDKIVSKKYGV